MTTDSLLLLFTAPLETAQSSTAVRIQSQSQSNIFLCLFLVLQRDVCPFFSPHSLFTVIINNKRISFYPLVSPTAPSNPSGSSKFYFNRLFLQHYIYFPYNWCIYRSLYQGKESATAAGACQRGVKESCYFNASAHRVPTDLLHELEHRKRKEPRIEAEKIK